MQRIIVLSALICSLMAGTLPGDIPATPDPVVLSSSAKGRIAARLSAKKSYNLDDLHDAILIEDIPLLQLVLGMYTGPLDQAVIRTGTFATNVGVLDLLLTQAGPMDHSKEANLPINLVDMAISSVKNGGNSWKQLECLLRHGHKPSLDTMEMLTVQPGHDKVLRTVLPYYKDPKVNILIQAYFNRGKDDVWIIEEFAKLGESIVGSDLDTQNPYLYQAIEMNLYETARILLRLGSSPNTIFTNYDFAQTPLELALELDRFDFFSLLVEHGADTSSSGNWSPRHQRWLKTLGYKNTFMTMHAGTYDDGSVLFMIPQETLGEIFSHLL